MPSVRIIEADTRRSLSHFIRFPEKLYQGDPLWVPPLWFFEKRDYLKKENPVLKRSDHALFLAKEGKKTVGRVAVYIDPRYNAFYLENTGMFGSFECRNHPEAARALFNAAESWLKERGMTRIVGPINPVAESWGFVLEGHDASPIYMSPYNPLYYNDLTSDSGYDKAIDLLVYEGDISRGYEMPDRFISFSRNLLKTRPQFSCRQIRKDALMEEARIIQYLLNEGIRGNWGFVPVEEDEMMDVVSKLKLILDERAVWFVEDEGKPVGVALGFPDINRVIHRMKGRFSPRGILTFLTQKKKIRDYRLWGLAVLPEYHGWGIDVLLYVNFYEALKEEGIRLEANYMLENNPSILNALEKMGLVPIKKYRVYEKPLL